MINQLIKNDLRVLGLEEGRIFPLQVIQAATVDCSGLNSRMFDRLQVPGVCVYQNSNPERTGQNARETIDISKRCKKFREQFSSTYGLPDRYFTAKSSKDNKTQFDRDCCKILDGFKSKFLAGGNRELYLNAFSHSKWSQLSADERKKHSLGKCAGCFELHKESQHSFPLKPTYEHKAIVTLDTDALQRLGVKKFTTSVLTECMKLRLAPLLVRL